MARCNHCGRSRLFLRTNPHGLCRSCQEKTRRKAAAERETIKKNLISARFLKDPAQKVRHLQSALESTRKLARHERLGHRQSEPSPKDLQAFLEGKLQEAIAAKRQGEAGAGSAVHTSAPYADPVALPPEDGSGGAPVPGTRRVRRHPAMFEVWVNRTTAALTEDISPLGLCVRSEALLRPGTRVGVTLEAPEGEVSGEGMVRWAHPADTDEESPIRAVMGVEFLVPPPELQRYG